MRRVEVGGALTAAAAVVVALSAPLGGIVLAEVVELAPAIVNGDHLLGPLIAGYAGECAKG